MDFFSPFCLAAAARFCSTLFFLSFSSLSCCFFFLRASFSCSFCSWAFFRFSSFSFSFCAWTFFRFSSRSFSFCRCMSFFFCSFSRLVFSLLLSFFFSAAFRSSRNSVSTSTTPSLSAISEGFVITACACPSGSFPSMFSAPSEFSSSVSFSGVKSATVKPAIFTFPRLI